MRRWEASDWTNSSGWLSQAPVGEWFGVETDEEGRVTALDLPYNGLTGHNPRRDRRLDPPGIAVVTRQRD